MSYRDRFELQIARLDGARLRHDIGRVTEFFDLDDDQVFEALCAKHFVPLACAAEGEPVRRRLRDMPWLAEYVLHLYRAGSRGEPAASSRSTTGWED